MPSIKETGAQGAEFERFGEVAVTSDAQLSLIIPTLRQIMEVERFDNVPEGQRNDKILSPVEERIALPIWGGQLTRLAYPPREVGKEKEYTSDVLDPPVSGLRLDNHFVSGDIPILLSPHITNSLLLSDNIALGVHGGSNPIDFTPERMVAAAQLGERLAQEDWRGIQRSLEEIEGGLLGYSSGLRLTEEDQQVYGRYGDRAQTAKIMDRKWFPALRDGASGDFVKNSILYGKSAACYVNGGTIKDSVVAVEDHAHAFSNMFLDNVRFITRDGGDEYFPPGGKVGAPKAAAQAVQFARGLPEQPLAELAKAA